MTEPTSVPIYVVTLEQCNICSSHYEQPKNTFVQPDINMNICKLIDISPSEMRNSHYFSQYIPICADCKKKLQKYDQLKRELIILKTEIIENLVDTLVHIRPSDNTPLHNYKNIILKRYTRSCTEESIPVQVSTTFGGSGSAETRTLNSKSSNVKSKKVQIQQQQQNNPQSFELDETNVIYFHEDSSATQSIYEETFIEDQIVEVDSVSNSESRKRNNNLKKEKVDEDDSGKKQRRLRRSKSQNKQNPPFLCLQCGKIFLKLASQKEHSSTCNLITDDSDQFSKKCICDIEFPSWSELKEHIDAEHPSIILDKCETCLEVFLEGRKHNPCPKIEEKPLPALERIRCNYCEKMFSGNKTLNKHIQTFHKDKGPLQCDICKKSFISGHALTKHKLMHKTDGRFKCEICSITTTTKFGLNQHFLIHTNSKPEVCEICGKSFRLRVTLQNHMRSHSKEKNYACSICGNKYTLYVTMLRHRKSHLRPAREGIFPCPLCSNSGNAKGNFRKITTLIDHMWKNHKGTVEEAQILEKYNDAFEEGQSQKKSANNFKKGKKSILKRIKTEHDIEEDESEGEETIFEENENEEKKIFSNSPEDNDEEEEEEEDPEDNEDEPESKEENEKLIQEKKKGKNSSNKKKIYKKKLQVIQ